MALERKSVIQRKRSPSRVGSPDRQGHFRPLPKRGFKNRNSKEIVGINVDALNRYEDGAVVTVETMIETGLVSNPRDGVKILGNGEVTKKLTVKANAFSESAKAKIEAAGGTVEVI